MLAKAPSQGSVSTSSTNMSSESSASADFATNSSVTFATETSVSFSTTSTTPTINESASPLEDESRYDTESIAEAFQERLFKKNLVEDHTDRLNPLKTHPRSFLGNDAVTALLHVLEKQQKKTHKKKDNHKSEISREDALNFGRKIAKEFHFFVHCGGDFSVQLQDSETELYQFHYNLPCQVLAMKQKHPSLWDKLALLESHVEIKERRQMFKVYENCFVAQEAVDSLVQLRLVKSRKEAVFLANRMNQRIGFCHHITDHEQDFEDACLFFHMKPKSERRAEPPKASPNNALTSNSDHARRMPVTSPHMAKSMRGGSLLSRAKSMKIKSSSPSTLKSCRQAPPSSLTSSTASAPPQLNSRSALLKKAQSIRIIRKSKTMGADSSVRSSLNAEPLTVTSLSEEFDFPTPHQPFVDFPAHQPFANKLDDSSKRVFGEDDTSTAATSLKSAPMPSPVVKTKATRKGGNKSRADEIRKGLQSFRDAKAAAVASKS